MGHGEQKKIKKKNQEKKEEGKKVWEMKCWQKFVWKSQNWGGVFVWKSQKWGARVFFFWTLLAVFLNTYSDVFRKCRYKLDKCC